MQKFLQDFSLPAAFAGFITFLVGISVSSVLVIQAAQLLGANTAEITSWFWALGIGIGLCGLILSWKFKYPVATSWSTAGLALILATGTGYSLPEALGAVVTHDDIAKVIECEAYVRYDSFPMICKGVFIHASNSFLFSFE